SQKTYDLLFAVALLHVQSPSSWDWTLNARATQFRGNVAAISVTSASGFEEAKVKVKLSGRLPLISSRAT
ncbi:MAG: hypothetical protein KDE46_25950, partial [Caldilineaceae bacterium]|nr:hypothetical protein [Caldilineaceae bacterium]